MLPKDDSNHLFQLAVDLVENTSQQIFLTGKAGTGKTTFLKYVKEHTRKNTVIVAPTGVAAINAGGVTMHSFFQLPRGLFVPGIIRPESIRYGGELVDKHSLFKNIHFNANKRELLQEVELLIIDEVSMVRCDMLDAIDTVLRHFRRLPTIPFGGVQVVYIGDLFQLPPVVNNEDWEILKDYYPSPFFFHSKVATEAPPLYIELKKIYRQSDQEFIDVLNRIRNNQPTTADFDFLNRKYDPSFVPQGEARWITVTTHNRKADAINISELERLKGKMHVFEAKVSADFPDKAHPTEVRLQLKEGAQVMFIKNDPERKYFNGKLATIKKIEGDLITAAFEDGSELELAKETWKNIRFVYNREKDEMEEEELGSFEQYPIRLAWAITVHKSQGLTFERAIIDAGTSFAPGQVYVALSRCTSMEGMVLRSRIHPFAVSTDKRIIEFAQKEISDTTTLESVLEREKYQHWARNLTKVFDWGKVVSSLYDWAKLIPSTKVLQNTVTLELAQSLLMKAKEQSETARKFQRQLSSILEQVHTDLDTNLLEERMKKAVAFFSKDLAEGILIPIQEHIAGIQYTSRVNKYREEVRTIEGVIWQQLLKLCDSSWGDLRFGDRNDFRHLDPLYQKRAKKAGREAKGSSQQTTFELYRTGKTIEEIAAMRSMAESTIGGHLAMFVRSGEIGATELVDRMKIDKVLQVIGEVGTESQGMIKSRLPEEISFFDIRVAINHYHFLQQKQTA